MADEKRKNNTNTLRLKKIYDIINNPDIAKRDQDTHILASDPAFIIILLQDILSKAANIAGPANGIFTPENQDILIRASETLDAAQISDALLLIFAKKHPTTGEVNLIWGAKPAQDEDEPNARYVHRVVRDASINVSAAKMLQLSPQSRVVLGFEGISFEDPQTGLITMPNKGLFRMSKSEMEAMIAKPNVTTYTGIDITTSVAIGKIITNIQDMKTISYSTHRANAQVRGCGSAYPRGISRGPRTIGGSIICTVRLMDPMKTLDPQMLLGYDDMVIESDVDLFKETMMPDQYPLFDLLIFYQNETGDSSAVIIYGISIHDTGQTSSISDTETEVQYVYTAVDMDPIRMLKFHKDGTIIHPFETNSYVKRKERIVKGLSLHGNPYDMPSVRTTHGNISHLEFIL